jgi:glycosyltransferase involved in cell wall biosynthesis
MKMYKKLKILIGCLSFSEFTGSEIYVYELAKFLVKEGHEVHIISRFGKKMKDKIKDFDVKLHDLHNPPNINFDIIHSNHTPITIHLLKIYTNIPFVMGIHSEIVDLESPVLNSRIEKYIAIRPGIKQHLMDKFYIPEEKISVIYNPFDMDRFNINNEVEVKENVVLFVGTIEHLRKKTIFDLVNYTKKENKELWVVGRKYLNYIDQIKDKHVKYFEPTWNIEKYVKQCGETAGILLGRTTIEGWLCGKPGWIYDVNSDGSINNKTLHPVPDDISKYYSKNVGELIVNEYQKILTNK